MPHNKQDDNGLSAEEFKNKMFGHLKKKGHINALKTQLRYKIVEELRGASVIRFPSESENNEDEMAFKLANSLVADHLRRNQFDYSLSVFLPESGSHHDQLYSAREVLHMLHLPPNSNLYTRLIECASSRPKKAILQTFLSELSRSSADLLKSGQMVKIESQESLGDKLLRLDQLHLTKRETLDQNQFVESEERILLYQRQLEERSRADLKVQMDRFREKELATIRIEERDKCRKELADARLEMERLYLAKMEALKERERNATERIQRQQEGQEKEIFTQRQSVLGEIELLRHRETQFRRQIEQQERDVKLQEERLKNMDNDLRKREMNVKQAENEFEIKLKEEMNKFRLEEELRYTQRVKQVEQAELANNEDRKIIDAEKHTLCELRSDLHDKQMKLNELEMSLQRVKLNVACLQNENDLLRRANQTIDYKYVKEENSMLKRELEVLKSRYGDMQRELESEKTAAERLQQQVVDPACRPSMGDMMNQRETGESRKSGSAMNANQDMIYRFEQQTKQHNEMNKEIKLLRQQLLSTQRSLRKGLIPKYGLTDSRSGSESDASATEDYFDTPLTKTNPEPELQLMQDQYASFRKSRSRASRLDSSLDSGDEIVVDAWKRLKQLEAETENLEASYRSFQARMSSLNSAVIPNETIRTTAAKYRVVFADTVSESRDLTGATSGGIGTTYKAGQMELAAPVSYSRVSFEESSKASPPLARTLAPKSKTPLSSTPYRPRKPKQHDVLDTKAQLSNDALPSFELSTVTSGTTSSDQRPPPLPKDSRPVTKPHHLHLADLEAGSQSASVVIVSGSQTTTVPSSSPERADVDATQNTSHGQDSTLKSHEPSGAIVDDTPMTLHPGDLATPSRTDGPSRRPVDTPSFDSPPAPTRLPVLERPKTHVSLDDAWKNSQVESAIRPLPRRLGSDESRERQDEEDRKFEEQRLRREEWRKRRDDEVKDKEQQDIELMAEERSSTSLKSSESVEEAGAIDPVMQKYMEMVQAQRTKQQETKQTTDEANEPSSVQSDNEISNGEGDEEKKSKTNYDSDSFGSF